MHDYTISLDGRWTVLNFPGKPAQEVLSAIKALGMRWDRHRFDGPAWVGSVDSTRLDKALREAYGLPPKPDGKCWKCESPDGFFRDHGPFSPVWCDACAGVSGPEVTA